MAGNYPDAPAPRMAYDRDGTVGFSINASNVVAVVSQASVAAMNDESENSMYTLPNTGFTEYTGLIFPQTRDIAAILWQANPHDSGALQTSVDSTNGLDGTWVSRGTVGRVLHTSSNGGTGGAIIPTYRTSITSVVYTGIKAVRLQLSTNFAKRIQTLHIYGKYSVAPGDFLQLWHPTLDEPLDDNTSADGAWLDWGDATRGTSADKLFRIKNSSATLTANSIVLSPQVLTDTSPTVSSQMTLSDGGAFTGSLNIGNIAPDTISPVITLRRTTLANATLSLWAGRININPGSWS